MRIHRVLARCLIFLALAATLAQDICARSIEGNTKEILNSADLLETKISLLVVDLQNSNEIVAINSDLPMIPASNMKLFTTAAAARVLGPDFVFRTELHLIRPEDWLKNDIAATSDGLPANVRHGTSLVVLGDGDPGFFDPKLLEEHGQSIESLMDTLVESVNAAGIKHIDHLIVDDRIFDTQLIHPSWPRDQLQNKYCAPVSGLNFYSNCMDIYVEPTQHGQSPKVRVYPDSPFLSTITRARTGSSDSFWISRKPGTNELTFWGTVKHRRAEPVQVTVDDPAIYFARLLAHRLSSKNIVVNAIARPGPNDQLPKGTTLYRIQTTLPALLSRCNKDSHNLTAEALLKRMGKKVTGSAGSWQSGAAAIRLFLTQPLGARGAVATIVDGSGLSRGNQITARLIVDLLREMYQNEQLGPIFHQSLSVGGVDGTLRKRFKGQLRERIFAKTGYIRQVSNISGYLAVTPQSPALNESDVVEDRIFAFSLLFNNIKPPVYVHQIKNLQDRILRFLESELSKQPPVVATNSPSIP